MVRNTLPPATDMPSLELPPGAAELSRRRRERCVVCDGDHNPTICRACLVAIALLLKPNKVQRRVVLERATAVTNANLLWLAYHNARGDWRRSMLHRLASALGNPSWATDAVDRGVRT